MREIGRGIKRIAKEERGLLAQLIVLFLMGGELILHTLLHFKSGTSIYIGYSDIGKFSGGELSSLWNSGGYRTGGWLDMAVFLVMGVVLGVMHNLMAIRIMNRREKGYAQTFIVMSMIIWAISFLVLMRLLGEI